MECGIASHFLLFLIYFIYFTFTTTQAELIIQNRQLTILTAKSVKTIPWRWCVVNTYRTIQEQYNCIGASLHPYPIIVLVLASQ